MGYPTGYSMNDKIFNFEENNPEIGFDNWVITEKAAVGLNDHDQSQITYRVCIKLIKAYQEAYKVFDYEEFYSFLKTEKLTTFDDIIKEAIRNTEYTHGDIIVNLKLIYSQMIRYCLKDKDGRHYYKEESHIGPLKNGYDNILKCISKLSNQYVIDVHTLNHDLLFESFEYTDYLRDKLSDGFSELGSPYYGKCFVDNCMCTIRLEHFKESNYDDKPIRLYKLHGSIDYVILKKECNELKLVKRKAGMIPDSIMEEVEGAYKPYPFHDFCDFLTGSEKEYCSEPYKNFIQLFKDNLKCAESLIIIGYGFKDKKINEIIWEYYNYKGKPIHIVDRNEVVKRGLELNAQFHPNGIEEAKFEELFKEKDILQRDTSEFYNKHIFQKS